MANIEDHTEKLSIRDSVMRIIADHLGLPASTLSLDDRIAEDLGGDSFDHIELMITIEERFGVRIPSSQYGTLLRIGDIVSFLESMPQN